MAISDNVDSTKTVANGATVFKSTHGWVAHYVGNAGGTVTVDLPAHVAKFFEDKGIVA